MSTAYTLQGFASKIKDSHITMGISVVFIASFISMVTSAYCADHIKKSAAWKAADADLTKAHSLATWTAVLSAFISLGSAGAFLWIGLRK